MSDKISANEVVQSLTGFEELAIDQWMKIDIYADGERKPMAAMRALAFVMHKRAGNKDTDARQYALGLPMGDLTALFADEEVEVDPEEPETPSGEGFAPSE